MRRPILLLAVLCWGFATLKSQSPQEISMYQTAEKIYLAGNYQQAFESLNNYVRTYPSGSYILPAVFNRGNALFKLQRYQEALSDYDYVAQAGNNPYVTTARARAKTIRDGRAPGSNTANRPNRPTAASSGRISNDPNFQSNTSSSNSFPTTAASNNAAAVSYADRNPLLQAYFLGVGAFKDQNYGLAKPHLQTVVNQDQGELAAESAHYLGVIAQASGQLSEAERAFVQANQRYGSYQYWTTKNSLSLTDIYLLQGQFRKAKTLLEQLLKGYFEDPRDANMAKQKLARINASLNNRPR